MKINYVRIYPVIFLDKQADLLKAIFVPICTIHDENFSLLITAGTFTIRITLWKFIFSTL